MNYKVIKRIIGQVLKFEAAFLLLPCITAVIYGEWQGLAYAAVAFGAFVLGMVLTKQKGGDLLFYAKEGFVIVGLAWLVLSLVGALPLWICRDIPSYIDALFETVSGFTTTGSSILKDVESLSYTSLMWRSFTHWVGGMGVMVFILAVLPSTGGYSMHIMKAESPGPSVGKLVPKVKDTAKILYGIYIGLTVLEIFVLLVSGMPIFDALCTGFGTAGTGGFGIKNDSMAGYSSLIQWIVTIFMILFGVNFNAYFYIIRGKIKSALKMDEVKVYLIIIATAIVIITMDTSYQVGDLIKAFRDASFQVGSVITTTGFATTDFNLWPTLSKCILVALMFVGACAGSTGGGIKVSRIMILFKSIGLEIQKYVHPRLVKNVTMDGKSLDNETLRTTKQYFLTYIVIMTISVLLISLEGLDFETTFTSVAATFNNIGPGLSIVGPCGNFADFGILSKLVFIFDMLAGRLELYPMLVLFVPQIWGIKNIK